MDWKNDKNTIKNAKKYSNKDYILLIKNSTIYGE